MDAARRCTAKSKQTGARCKRSAIVGGFVCHMHGAAAAQTRTAARARLAAAADPAAAALIELTFHDDPTIRFRSSTAVLDRAGIPDFMADPTPDRTRQVQATAAKLSAVIAGVLTDLGHDVADPYVRSIVAGRLRSMSADTRHEALDTTARELSG